MECRLPISLACGKQMVPRSWLGPGSGLEERGAGCVSSCILCPTLSSCSALQGQGTGPVSVDVSVCWEGEILSFSRGKTLLGTKKCQMGFGDMVLVVLGHSCAELLAKQLCKVARMHNLA